MAHRHNDSLMGSETPEAVIFQQHKHQLMTINDSARLRGDEPTNFMGEAVRRENLLLFEVLWKFHKHIFRSVRKKRGKRDHLYKTRGLCACVCVRVRDPLPPSHSISNRLPWNQVKRLAGSLEGRGDALTYHQKPR